LEYGFSLRKLSLIRPRIDFCQNIPDFDLLPVGESNALQIAIDARLNVDRVKGRHRSKSSALDW
jgi:hypothetical protein